MADVVTTLIPGTVYRHFGRLMIAVSTTDLELVYPGDGVTYLANEGTELVYRPGTEGWVQFMLTYRDTVMRDLRNERAEVQEWKNRWENLGAAILEKAEHHQWCEEYDDFAEEWDLPQRQREYDVVVSVRVRARSEDEARDTVMEEVRIDQYHHVVVTGPEVEVEAAY